MSIVLVGSTSGSITLQEPAIAGSTTINLPATSGTALVAPTALTVPNTTGTVMVSGNMPAFSAFQSTLQAFSAFTLTKIAFQTEEYDTANAFDSTTNYRFQPQVAGYYQITGACSFGGAANTKQVTVYKNGSNYKQGSDATQTQCTVCCLVYLNGSTDYVEVYGFTASSTNTDALSTRTYFQAAMVRAA